MIVHYHLGIIYERKRMWHEAIREFLQVVSENPNDASSHFHLGLAYKRLGVRDLAVGEFMMALDLDPEDNASLEQLQGLQG
jgi:Flp pilus assembly protein TadD